MMEPVFRTPPDRHYYFGYYDKSPVSMDGTKHLALAVGFMDRLPGAADRAEIGWFDFLAKSPRFRPIAETSAFNWQQGCMLQWIGDRTSEIIYNDFIEGRFVSVIAGLDGRRKKILPMAVYAVHPGGKTALCIDNERHHWCRRGYSYEGIPNPSKSGKVVPGDGIWLLDLDKGDARSVIGIEQLLVRSPLPTMKNAIHYVEHMMWSPAGTRFAFFHRWKMESGGIHSRLYACDSDGGEMVLLNDSGRMSHFCWRSESEILGWGGLANPINSLRKLSVAKFLIKPLLPLYKRIVRGNAIDGTSKLSKMITGDGYLLFDIATGSRKRLSHDFLDRDGHPSFEPGNPRRFITDTYPDRSSVARLLQYDIGSQAGEVIAEVASIPAFDNSPNRCDLHPKWSYDGKYVSIDTMDRGARGIYVYSMKAKADPR